MVICCLNISTRPLSFVSRPLSYVSSDDLILVSDIIPKVALWAEILSKLRALPHGNARLPIDSIDTNTTHIHFISISYPFHIHTSSEGREHDGTCVGSKLLVTGHKLRNSSEHAVLKIPYNKLP